MRSFRLIAVFISILYILLMLTVLAKFMRSIGLFSVIFYIVPILLLVTAVFIPKIVKGRKKKEIEDNLHFYITHLGVLATSEITRKEMMKILSERKEYKALAEETRKIYLLMDKWKRNLAQACRFIAKRTPSRVFADFLDRMAHELDSGADFRDFIKREQNVVMNAFATIYQGKLYSIDVFKEVYVSVIISLAFFASFAIIAPFLTGLSVMTVLNVVMFLMIVIEVGLLLYVKMVSPVDPIWQTSGEITSVDKKIYKTFYLACLICLGVFTLLLFLVYVFGYFDIPIPFIVSLTLTPMLIPGVVSKREESKIVNRDKNAPSFFMSLGASASAMGGNIITALKFLTAHDFGELTKNVKALYKRLSVRLNKNLAWKKFSIETGSNLIYRFTDMFVEAINLGSDPKEVAEIVSNNFNVINSLRDRRARSVSSLIGICYGAIIGMAFSFYVSYGVIEIMSKLYSSLKVPTELIGGLLYPIPSLDMAYLNVAIQIILMLHAVIASIIVKIVDGGRWMSGLVHTVGMLWVAAVSGYVSKMLISHIFTV